jgi:ferric-dicitrate binding protein FerR (iron transport regulator)
MDAEWLIRLDADNSAALIAQWRQWLAENPRNQAAYRRLEKIWRETDCLKNLRPVDGTVSLDVLEAFSAATG